MIAVEESLHDLSPAKNPWLAVSWLSVSTVMALNSFKLAYNDIEQYTVIYRSYNSIYNC